MSMAMGGGLAMTVLIGAATADAAEAACGQYSALTKLPVQFGEVAHGELYNAKSRRFAEFFILSDGACTCDNKPSVDRQFGRVASADVYWSCRAATSDEREAIR